MLKDLLRKLTSLTRSDGLSVVRVGSRVWYLSPVGVELFGSAGPDLDHWLGSGAAVVVKSNPARTVYRVALAGATVFVKHCKISGLRALGREFIRPPKARLEFQNTRALRERGVAAIEPLAWGGPDSPWPGESFLITRELTDAIPFIRYLEHILPTLSPAEHRMARRFVARALGRFVARLHDAGVAHPDPHPGNLLVELGNAPAPQFALIDLHAVHVGPSLNWTESRKNLVLFNRWFQLRGSRVDRSRFWQAYRTARTTLPAPSIGELREGAKELERSTVDSNLRFWSGRESRCLGSNRYFRRIRRGAFHGFAVRDISDTFLRQLLAQPDRVLDNDGGEYFKNSRTSTVAVLMMQSPNGATPVVLKRVNVRSRIEPLKNLLRSSQVLRSWVNGHSLRDRCLSTPRPLAVFHRYRHGLPAEGYLLTELVPDPTPLARGIKSVALRLARLLRTMHDRGVSHRDLKSANVILAHGKDPILIDLVGVRTGNPPGEQQRAKELARLNASFLDSSAVTTTDRLRFLHAYLAAGTGSQEGWKSWWKMVSQATAAKVAKNRRNGRSLG